LPTWMQAQDSLAKHLFMYMIIRISHD